MGKRSRQEMNAVPERRLSTRPHITLIVLAIIFSASVFGAYLVEKSMLDKLHGFTPIEDAIKLIFVAVILVTYKKRLKPLKSLTLRPALAAFVPAVAFAVSYYYGPWEWAGIRPNVAFALGVATTAVSEELLFRYLSDKLFSERQLRTPACFFFIVSVFAVSHFAGLLFRGMASTLLQVLLAFCIGTLYLAVYLKTRSWLLTAAAHFCLNYFSSFFTLNMHTEPLMEWNDAAVYVPDSLRIAAFVFAYAFSFVAGICIYHKYMTATSAIENNNLPCA